jgi:hypothetical protein
MTDSLTTEPAEPEQADAPHPWADLAAQQFSLLRLAPLPFDRHTGARPLRFVQLGRAERNSQTESLLRLTLQLPDQALRKEQNTLEVWVDHSQRIVRFGPDSGLLVEPENRGLGRFLLAQGIAWARQSWAQYAVDSCPLTTSFNEEARDRRDRCLQAQGFVVEYLDPLRIKAQCNAEQVSTLQPDWNSEKVQIVELLDAANMLQQADQNLREQDIAIRKQNERIALLKSEDNNLRFTIACLVAFSVFQAGLLIWIATR